MQIIDRDHLLGTGAPHPGLLGTDLEQFGDGIRCLTLGPGLEEATEEDQGDDDRRGLEEQCVFRGECVERESPRRNRADRHQRVHRRAQTLDLLEGRSVELGTESKEHAGGEQGLKVLGPLSIRTELGEHKHRNREERGADDIAPLVPDLFGVPFGDVGAIVPFFDLVYRIPDLGHRSLEDLDVHVGPDLCPSFMAGVVDDGALNALLLAEDALDPESARGTGHPFDIEGDGFGCRLTHDRPGPRSCAAGVWLLGYLVALPFDGVDYCGIGALGTVEVHRDGSFVNGNLDQFNAVQWTHGALDGALAVSAGDVGYRQGSSGHGCALRL